MYNNMQANILPLHTHTHLTPGRGLKIKNLFFRLKVVICISNEQEGWSCTYHGHLYHGWVVGSVCVGGFFNPEGTHVLHSNMPRPCFI